MILEAWLGKVNGDMRVIGLTHDTYNTTSYWTPNIGPTNEWGKQTCNEKHLIRQITI